MPRTLGGPRGTTSPCPGVPLSLPPRQLWRPPHRPPRQLWRPPRRPRRTPWRRSAGPGPRAMVGVAPPMLWCLRGARHPRLLGRLLRGQRGTTTSAIIGCLRGSTLFRTGLARDCLFARHHRQLRRPQRRQLRRPRAVVEGGRRTQRARKAQERVARSRNRKARSNRRTITLGTQVYSRRKVVRVGQQDAAGYGGHIHADVSLPSALTTTWRCRRRRTESGARR